MDDNQMIHIPAEGGELFSDDLDLTSNESDEIFDRNIAPVQDQDYQQLLDTIIDTIDTAIREQHALYIKNYQNSKRKPVIDPKKSPETFLYLHADECHHTLIALTQQHCPADNLQYMINDEGLFRKLRLKNPLFDRAIGSSVDYLHEKFAKVTPLTLDSIDEPILQLDLSFNQLAQPIKTYIMEKAKHQRKTTNYWLQDDDSNEKIKSSPHNLYLCRQAVTNATALSLPFLYGASKYKQLTEYEQKNILAPEITKKELLCSIQKPSTKQKSQRIKQEKLTSPN